MKLISTFLASQLLFFPSSDFVAHPKQFTELVTKDVWISTPNGNKLHGWHFTGNLKNKTLLWSHGNAGNISDRLDRVRSLIKLGWNILIYDYQGYGKSEGKPTIDGLLTDGLSAYEWLTAQGINPNDIVVLGISLGGAVATHIATHKPIGGVILENTFTSLQDISKATNPLLPKSLVPNVYRIIDQVKHISAPKLIIHATQDEIIPFTMGQTIFKNAQAPKTFYAGKNAKHDDTYLVDEIEYLNTIEEFLKKL